MRKLRYAYVWTLLTLGAAACNAIWGIGEPNVVGDDAGDDGSAAQDAARDAVGGNDATGSEASDDGNAGDVTNGDAMMDVRADVSADAGADVTSDVTLDGGDATSEASVDAAQDASVDAGCAHDCLGGMCVNGVCQPVVVATAQHHPYGIAVDSTGIYWSNDITPAGSIVHSRADGTGQSPLASNRPSPNVLAVGAGHVFWAEQDALCDLPVDGGAPSCFAQVGVQAQAIVTSGGTSYITDNGNNTVWARTPGGASTTVSSGPSGANGPRGLVATQSNLVWLSAGSPDGGTGAGQVRQCTQSGCGGSMILHAGESEPRALAIDPLGLSLFWTNAGTSMVRTCDYSTSCTTGVDFASSTNPGGIAIDGSNVYWIEAGSSGKIKSCPIAGVPCTSPVVLATSQSNPTSIAVDSVAVYWTNFGVTASDGTVVRVAK